MNQRFKIMLEIELPSQPTTFEQISEQATRIIASLGHVSPFHIGDVLMRRDAEVEVMPIGLPRIKIREGGA